MRKIDKINDVVIEHNGQKRYIENIAGRKYGRLTAIEFSHISDKGHHIWKFKCDCGNTIIRNKENNKNKNMSSCGCFRIKCDTIKKFKLRKDFDEIKPLLYRTHNSWYAMKSRCNNPKNSNYPVYGARGIKVCDRWMDFNNFFEDIGVIPEGMTLERVDVNGNYCPENVILIPHKEQWKNRRNTPRVTFNDKEMTLLDCVNENTDVPYHVVKRRLDSSWSLDDALFTPVDTCSKRKNDPVPIKMDGYVIDGETLTLKELVNRKASVSYQAVIIRLMNGWSIDDALNKPVMEVKPRKTYILNGQNVTLKEYVSAQSNVKYRTVLNRMRLGWSLDDAMSKDLIVDSTEKEYLVNNEMLTLRQCINKYAPDLIMETLKGRLNRGKSIYDALGITKH